MVVQNVTSFILTMFFLLTTAQAQNSDYRTNRTCTADVDCLPQHSVCTENKICDCADNYVGVNRNRFNNFLCLKVAIEEGDSCVHKLQCEMLLGSRGGCILVSYNESDPQEGECHCLPNHHKVGSRCYQTILMGDYCKVNNECYLERKDITSYCTAGACICPLGYHPSKERNNCIENEGVPSPCQDNSDCKYPNSYCSINVCICEDKYIMTPDKMACEIPLFKLGSHCTSDDQCNRYLKETSCHPVTKTCVCSEGAQEIDHSCYRISRLGDVCEDRLECVIQSHPRRVDCIGNICACNNYYLEEENDCTTLSEVTRRHSESNSSSKLNEHLLGTLMSCLLLHVMIYSTKIQKDVLS